MEVKLEYLVVIVLSIYILYRAIKPKTRDKGDIPPHKVYKRVEIGSWYTTENDNDAIICKAEGDFKDILGINTDYIILSEYLRKNAEFVEKNTPILKLRFNDFNSSVENGVIKVEIDLSDIQMGYLNAYKSGYLQYLKNSSEHIYQGDDICKIYPYMFCPKCNAKIDVREKIIHNGICDGINRESHCKIINEDNRNYSYTKIKKIPNINPNSVWVGKDKEVTIHGVVITKGFIYVGEYLRSFNDEYTNDASLIVPSLKASFIEPNYESSSYADSYSSSWDENILIMRGAYLLWLASNRDDPETCITYIMLYLFGLERRLLYDIDICNVSIIEIEELINEVNRIQLIYRTIIIIIKKYA